MVWSEKPNLEKDIIYIKEDLIAQQINGKYCKFSKLLGAISIIDLTEEFYTRYWLSKYNYETPENQLLIKEACRYKFSEGLVPREKMIKLVEKSNDFTKDRYDVLSKLK